MGLFVSHRVNEGMHIEGKGISVDVIVKEIGGDIKFRTAILEIKGVENLHYLNIKWFDGLVKIIDGVYVGVRDKRLSSKDKIRMHYSANDEYCFVRKDL
ncbi:MAG TPA: hypothetical protein VJH65_03450 [Candidatus Nanoarchaeia archaeon]|nr:hypothetical protein [Candidatus Nanoarchaeia archaeon]